MSFANIMRSYRNKSFGYVIPNTKALKKWLIIENFHFFHRNFANFSRYGFCQNTKKCRTLSLGSSTKNCQIKTLDSYYSQHESEENLTKIQKFSFFHWQFRNFCWDKNNNRSLETQKIDPWKHHEKLPKQFLWICYS